MSQKCFLIFCELEIKIVCLMLNLTLFDQWTCPFLYLDESISNFRVSGGCFHFY